MLAAVELVGLNQVAYGIVVIGERFVQPIDVYGFQAVQRVVAVTDRVAAGIGQLGQIAGGVVLVLDVKAVRVGGADQASGGIVAVAGIADLLEFAAGGVTASDGVAVAVGMADDSAGVVVHRAAGVAQRIGTLGRQDAFVVLKLGGGIGLVGQAGLAANGIVLGGNGGVCSGLCGSRQDISVIGVLRERAAGISAAGDQAGGGIARLDCLTQRITGRDGVVFGIVVDLAVMIQCIGDLGQAILRIVNKLGCLI